MSNVQTLVEEISKMTVLEIVDLVKALEEKFGVSAAAAVQVASAGAAPAAAAAEEKKTADVMLTKIGANKISVIKVIRELTGLGLKEAKDLVEAAEKGPSKVKENVAKEEAANMKKKLEEAGATVELK